MTPELRQRANARNLVVHTALSGAIEGGIVAYVPVLLARLGAGATTVSLLNSGLALANIAMALPAGPMVASQRDLVGYVSRWILAIRALFLAIALLPFFDGWWVPLAIVALWSLHGVPAALVNNGFFGILAEAVPPRERPRLNGIRWGLFGAVAAAVTGVFGYMLDLLPFPLGYQIVFALSALLGTVGVVYFSRIVVPPPEPTSEETRRGFAELFWPRAAGREFLEFQLLTGLLRVGLHLPIGLFSIWWVNELQATDTFIGIRSTVANGALVVGYFGWGWISARIGYRWTLGVSSGGMALYPALTAIGPTAEWMLPAAFCWGVFVAGVDFALVEGLLRASPADRRAEFVAVHHFQANVVAFVAPLVGAWLAERTSVPQVMLVATVFHGAVLLAMAVPRRTPGSPRRSGATRRDPGRTSSTAAARAAGARRAHTYAAARSSSSPSGSAWIARPYWPAGRFLIARSAASASVGADHSTAPSRRRRTGRRTASAARPGGRGTPRPARSRPAAPRRPARS